MGNRVTERIGDIGSRARERTTQHRLDRMDRENDRLKQEVHLLRKDLTEERGTLERAIEALGRDEHIDVHTKAPRKRGRILRLLAIGAGAYVLGARAGRGRYDRIVDTAKGLKSSMQRKQGGALPPWARPETPAPSMDDTRTVGA